MYNPKRKTNSCLLKYWTQVLNDSLFKSFPDCPYLKDQCSQRDTSVTYAKEKLYPFTQETLTLKKTLHPSSGSKDSLIKFPGKLIKVKAKFNVLLLPYCINESMMSKGKIERNNQY